MLDQSTRPAAFAVWIWLLLGAILSFVPPATGSAAAAPGSIDRTFSGDGFVLEGFGSEPGRGGAARVALQSDGKAVMFVPTFRGYSLVRYMQDGRLDPTFGDGGFRSGDFGAPLRFEARAMAIQPDGKIVVAGTRYGKADTGAGARSAVARYMPDGDLDPGFGHGGSVIVPRRSPEVSAGAEVVVLEPDGKMILVGRVEEPSGYGLESVRLKPDGGIDRSFGESGFSVLPLDNRHISMPLRAVVQAGKLTVAIGSEPRFLLVRLNSDGALDASLGGDGTAASDLLAEVTDLAVQPDGRIVVSGHYGGLARLLPDGSPDPNFGAGGRVLLSQPRLIASAISLHPDGAILLAGHVEGETPGAPGDFMLARLTSNGALDPSMGAGRGFVTTDVAAGSPDQAEDLALLPDGRVLLVGGTGTLRIRDLIVAARYNADGSLDTGFGGGGTISARPQVPARDVVSDLLVDRQGRVTATGRAAGKIAVVRYLRDGRRDLSFGNGGIVTAVVTGAPLGEQGESLVRYRDGRLLVGSGSGQGGALLRYLPNGTPDPDFGADGVARTGSLNHVLDLAVLKDGAILAVGLTSECSVRLARFTQGGAPDPRFGGGDGLVAGPGIAGFCWLPDLSLAVQPSGRILIAGNESSPFLSAYSATGKRVKRFGGVGYYGLGTLLPQKVRALATDRAGRIVVAGSSQRRFGLPRRRFGLVRLMPDGSADRSFGRNGSVSTGIGSWSEVRDVRIGADGMIVAVGASGTCRGRGACADVRLALARYEGTGSLDRSFGRNGVWIGQVGASSSLNALALGRETIVAGGWAAVSAQDRQFLLVRLHR